jgi:hypothetical protein
MSIRFVVFVVVVVVTAMSKGIGHAATDSMYCTNVRTIRDVDKSLWKQTVVWCVYIK